VHLGQILTYAAGLDAATIVWIASKFTEEHRAALDWLNEITTDDISFFGLEVELWKIGDSPIAPKFNLVSKPNEWTRSAGSGARASKEMSPTKKLQLEYWTAFRGLVSAKAKRVKATKPQPQHWINFSIGRAYFGMYSFVDTQNPRIGVRLFLEGPDAKAHFSLLEQEKSEIEADFGEPLLWQELPEKNQVTSVCTKPRRTPRRKIAGLFSMNGCFPSLKNSMKFFPIGLKSSMLSIWGQSSRTNSSSVEVWS